MIKSQHSLWAPLLIALALVACQADNVDEIDKQLNKPPNLTISTDKISVPENTTAVPVTVTASDPNRRPLRFSLGGADKESFGIEASSGVLTFKYPPDYEVPTDSGGDNIYNVIIIVTNSNINLTASVGLEVTVTNDPRTPENTAPVVNMISSNFAINENSIGLVVTTISAIDADNNPLTYSLSGVGVGADAAQFTLDPSSGELRFKTMPDFEVAKDAGANHIYELKVTVYDGIVVVDKSFTVTVINIEEVPVFNTTITELSVPENTTAVGHFTAVDPDGFTVTYDLAGADAALFSYANGELRFIAAPDYERPAAAGGKNNYAVSVIATDTAHTKTHLTLTIAVTDVTAGDFDPTFGPDGQGGFKGYITHNQSGSNDDGQSVALTPDGKLVVVGSTYGSVTSYDLAVWQLNADGTLDNDPTTGFGPAHQGYQTHHNAAGGDSYDAGRSVTLTTNSAGQLDKIVVVGFTNSGSTWKDLAVWRIQY